MSALWSAVQACAANDKRGEGAELREEVGDAVSALTNSSRQLEVYVTRTNQSGYRNQVWQGQGNSRHNDVMVLINTTGNEAGVGEEARGRLNPRSKNGFDAVVVCEPSAEGFDIKGVVEYPTGVIGSTLQARLGTGIELLQVQDPGIAPSLDPQFPPHDEETSDERVFSDTLVAHLLEAKNVILAGPPGTGKTHLALEAVSHFSNADPEACRLETVLSGRSIADVPNTELNEPAVIWEIVQFHPAYGYEEFIRGLRTDPESKGFTLKSFDGILPIMAEVSAKRGDKPTLLIIDEINRSNLSLALGEAIFAIDPNHRGRPVRLQYPSPEGGKDALIIPPALYILATMNTADRSIAVMDFAVRRRFRLLHMRPSQSIVTEYYGDYGKRADVAWTVLAGVNASVSDADYHVGQSYVMSGADLDDPAWIEAFCEKVIRELRPLLFEYVQENVASSTIALSLGGRDVDVMTCSTEEFAAAVQAEVQADG